MIDVNIQLFGGRGAFFRTQKTHPLTLCVTRVCFNIKDYFKINRDFL